MEGELRETARWVWTWKAVPARFDLYPEEIARHLERGWRIGYYARVQIVSGGVFVPYNRYAKRLSLWGMESRRAFWFALRALGDGAKVIRFTPRHMEVELGGKPIRIGAAITPTARPLEQKGVDLLAALSGSGQENRPGSILVPMDPVPSVWKGSLSDALWLKVGPLLIEGSYQAHRWPLRLRLDVALALHHRALSHKDLPNPLYQSAMRLKAHLEEWGLWEVILKVLEEAGWKG